MNRADESTITSIHRGLTYSSPIFNCFCVIFYESNTVLNIEVFFPHIELSNVTVAASLGYFVLKSVKMLDILDNKITFTFFSQGPN